jgi:hypothetical protein
VLAAEYERLVLRELHRILIDPVGQAENFRYRGETLRGVRVGEVGLDVSGPGHEIVIVSRGLNRPRCHFDHRRPALAGPAVHDERPLAPTSTRRTPQTYAEMT